ncbi:adenylate/guanylate cyclase domain-containing protein [Ralstonia sp.]|uniref:adenylate/guanylate cyclase domain-containing protein n=1 Tax=Ralstonia sp. TaxID=54061 RepID=UPI002579D33C|nr:adenylate/guanylate cyclase domain-containing protein [Ralstonia sp.]MBA4203306.1 hypothetical protein [Ralstonia sp.]
MTTIYYSSCRTHIASYGFAPLAQLASDNDFIFHPSNAVQLLTVGSDVYYAAVTKVSLPYPGISIWLALVMPEADVIGDVVTGRNTAIGITCGVFVVVACLSFGLISLLLRPLTTIADRMMLAASLEDDGNGEKELSSMAEVEDLQQAYYAMNDELIRIKSFVPQTVLRTKRAADPDESATEDEDGRSQSKERETTQSNASRRPPASVKSASYSRKSSNRAAVAGLNVACGLASQSVSVVVANLNRFEATANDTSRDAVVAAVGDTVKMVHDVVAAQKGVVQSFHGDHFVVSFNAVTACAAHARRAAVKALQLSREARGVGLRLGLRAGVGTGRCLVGNLGSAEAKGFSTIGSAFAHANVMERLTRVYGEGCQVLAAKRTCVDIATHVRYRYVDVVQLPRLKGATLIGALLGEANGHDDAAKNGGGGAGVAAESEWLYIVENTTGSDGAINAAFTALFEGKVDEANALLGKGLKDVADVQSGNIHSRVLEVRDEMVSKGLTTVPVRDLGLLYRAGFRIDEH